MDAGSEFQRAAAAATARARVRGEEGGDAGTGRCFTSGGRRVSRRPQGEPQQKRTDGSIGPATRRVRVRETPGRFSRPTFTADGPDRRRRRRTFPMPPSATCSAAAVAGLFRRRRRRLVALFPAVGDARSARSHGSPAPAPPARRRAPALRLAAAPITRPPPLGRRRIRTVPPSVRAALRGGWTRTLPRCRRWTRTQHGRHSPRGDRRDEGNSPRALTAVAVKARVPLRLKEE